MGQESPGSNEPGPAPDGLGPEDKDCQALERGGSRDVSLERLRGPERPPGPGGHHPEAVKVTGP